MDHVLKKMQKTVSKYAAVLSDVLKVDVEIADSNLERICGTGRFEKKVNKNMADEGCAYREVLDTGEMRIIENPGLDNVCSHCPKKDNCDEVYEISTPIKLEDKVIGVIGFVCFTEQQKKHITENFDTFVEFSGHISDLIASKAFEVMENDKRIVFLDLLNKIIDKIDQGVIVYDRNFQISKSNLIAEEMLNLDNAANEKKLSIESTGNFILDSAEYILQINNSSHHLVGKIFDINIGEYNKFFIFKDADLVQEQARSIATSRETIGLERTYGNSPQINALKSKVKMVAKTNSTVLINGESGTGKELLARALHEESTRADGPFVAINCGAIPENLIESELFGYNKGAFTGADPRGKIGKFELANKGTLFLDEIGDMPLYVQVKLLRALEEREIVRVGSNRNIKIDVRVIAATNKNLEDMIIEKTFREDLFYRLNVIPLVLPPLRERSGDIKELSFYFIEKYSQLFEKKVIKIEDDFWKYIEEYDWPGNIRELQNTIEYVIIMLGRPEVIKAELLPKKIINNTINLEIEDFNIENMEKKIIQKAIDLYGDDADSKKTAADKLGIGIATLYRKMKKYNIK